MVEFVDDKRVEYASRFSVCGDGHVLQTIKYETMEAWILMCYMTVVNH